VRYRGAESHYMDLANVASNSQDSHLLPMMLLEMLNSHRTNFKEQKLQLFQQSKQRAALSGSSASDVSKQHSEKCMNMLDTIHSLLGNSTEDHTCISTSTYILSTEQRKPLLDGFSFLNESTSSPIFHTNRSRSKSSPHQYSWKMLCLSFRH
jgi:hypothetical protein